MANILKEVKLIENNCIELHHLEPQRSLGYVTANKATANLAVRFSGIPSAVSDLKLFSVIENSCI